MQGHIELNRIMFVMAVVLLCTSSVGAGDRRAASKSQRADNHRTALLGGAVLLASDGADGDTSSSAERPSYITEHLRGRVVWLAEALKRRFNVETDADASAWIVALETDDGHLHPIIKDVRGRGFLVDARLRDVDMELVVRRHTGSPMIQVVRLYTLKADGLYEVDYWCDICAILMFELKECECCQGETRIRERKVDPASRRTTDEEPPEDRRLNRRK